MTFGERLQHAWNAFKDGQIPNRLQYDPSMSYSYSPTTTRFHRGIDRSIVNAIYTRIAIDVAAIKIQHIKVDDNGQYVRQIDSTLNTCLNKSANIDQTGRALIQDIVMSLCDEGSVAVVPVDTSEDPSLTESYKILSLRVGKITEWRASSVAVNIYNDQTGKREDLLLPKKLIAIIENPLYAIMNEPNSTLKRLTHKMNLLDAIDEQSSAGKLDLIIQLPYVIKSDTHKKQAEKRRKDIEMQLTGSKYGIAYTDGTEKITQLNRPIENNLMEQITYLTNTAYNQLGITEDVFNGTANEATMLNYHNRTIEPFLSAIVDEFNRKFLTKTARSQGQAIAFFKDPFKMVPTSQIAEIADKFTRNEILSPNEVRTIIGYKPSDDPKANELRNRNLNQDASPSPTPPVNPDQKEDQ